MYLSKIVWLYCCLCIYCKYVAVALEKGCLEVLHLELLLLGGKSEFLGLYESEVLLKSGYGILKYRSQRSMIRTPNQYKRLKRICKSSNNRHEHHLKTNQCIL